MQVEGARCSLGRLSPLAAALLLGACAPPAPTVQPASVDQRLQRLEGRVESLERRDTIAPAPPLRPREEIEANIVSLEDERATLLAKYHSAHPDIRSIDRRLQLLRKQLEMLDQTSGTAAKERASAIFPNAP